MAIFSALRFVKVLPAQAVKMLLAVGLRLSWRLSKVVELSMAAQNLANNHYTELIPSRPAPKDIERSIYGKVACRF